MAIRVARFTRRVHQSATASLSFIISLTLVIDNLSFSFSLSLSLSISISLLICLFICFSERLSLCLSIYRLFHSSLTQGSRCARRRRSGHRPRDRAAVSGAHAGHAHRTYAQGSASRHAAFIFLPISLFTAQFICSCHPTPSPPPPFRCSVL